MATAATGSRLTDRSHSDPTLLPSVHDEDDAAGHAHTLADASFAGDTAAPRLIAGATIGRYVLQRRLGEGGMGVVWTAHDPELDRPVAIKLLTNSRSDSQARLLREAQAMAKLAHPNVVAVFDVGIHAGQVYVAMELVAGVTLRAWLDADLRRPWRNIVDMFLQAGQGLAAAHAAGLVHRDFKPENALVGEDGRLRVLDFGLAALRDLSGPGPQQPNTQAREASMLTSQLSVAIGISGPNSQLTQAGAVMGTLAYMSPEQHLGLAVDPRSDQFSFCVALYAALHGQQPFAGTTAGELTLNVIDGRLCPPPRGTRVPRRITRAIARGLTPNPTRRHASMPALLAELSRETWVRRQRWLVGAVAAALIGAGASALLQPVTATCEDPALAWAHVWNDAAKTELRARYAATGQPFATAAADGFITRIDRYLAAWGELHAHSCNERKRALPDRLQLRQSDCLDRLLARATATIEVQRAADASAVTHAIEAAEALPPVSRCADANALLAEVAPPDDPALAGTIARFADAIVRADAEIGSGRYRRAREILLALREQPELARHPPTHAEVLYGLGTVAFSLGDYSGAREHLADAHWIALAAGADEMALAAAAALPDLLIAELGEREAGRQWLRTGEALMARTGQRSSLSFLLRGRADLAVAERQFGRAVEHAREALSVAEEVGGRHTLATADALLVLGQTLRVDGQRGASLAAYDRAQAIYEASVSPDHPLLAWVANNRAITVELDDPEQALREFLRARDLLDRSLGGDTVMLAAILTNLADVQVRAGDTEAAEHNARRGAALYLAELGPTPRTAHALNALAILLIRKGQFRSARDAAMRSVEMLTRHLGPDAFELSYPLHSLAVAERGLGDCVAASRHFRRALELCERTLGADNPINSPEWRGLGECALDGARPQEALAHFTRALALATTGDNPLVLLFARFHVATARWDLGERTAARAEVLAVQAALPDHDINVEPHHRAELERWLAEHPL